MALAGIGLVVGERWLQRGVQALYQHGGFLPVSPPVMDPMACDPLISIQIDSLGPCGMIDVLFVGVCAPPGELWTLTTLKWWFGSKWALDVLKSSWSPLCLLNPVFWTLRLPMGCNWMV